ncbi:transmembrane protease serine 9-like [Macrobrachium nipponense]|uniref:transmembrane protease serine 9-like n=1 Tax=Macrobrachium nipponense TaxID=159736 RepID=UPI0030C83FF4
MANALYILNMADGNGSPFCGALTGYETYVKVKSSQTGLANLLSLPEHVIFLINTKTVATTVNPTKFQLRMTQIPCNDVNVFAGRSIENAEDASPVGSAREGRRKYYHRVKAPSASKGPSSSRKPTRHEVTSAELLTCLGNTTSRIYLPPFPITLSFLGNNIFADLIQKIARKDGLVLPTRIAGGTTITDVRSQYPWLGYMLIRNDNDEPFFCGAVLISPKYALTAAHCVMQRGFSRNRYQIKARFGRTDISNDQNVVNLSDLWVDQQSVTVERTVVHAMFDSVTLEDDIAVLELATPVNLTPVRLPSADAAYVGRAGKVLGWGYTGVNSGMPRNPQVLDVTVLTNDACDAAWKGLYSAYTYTPPRYIQDNMVCSSANTPNAGTCGGDSGGPLVVEEAGGTHTLVGILSGAFFDCVTKGNGPEVPIGGTPNVATRVSEVLDFINVATS